jgi:hypothetical protein
MTPEQSFFAVFCIESLADELKTTGDIIYKKLTEESDILDAYIVPHYEAFHTQSKGYIVNELNELMKKRDLPKISFNPQISAYRKLRGTKMMASRTLVGRKCSNVIKAYAERAGIPLREAFDVFYKSHLYIEIRHGISDMHCRSDGYLAEELELYSLINEGLNQIKQDKAKPMSESLQLIRASLNQ